MRTRRINIEVPLPRRVAETEIEMETEETGIETEGRVIGRKVEITMVREIGIDTKIGVVKLTEMTGLVEAEIERGGERRRVAAAGTKTEIGVTATAVKTPSESTMISARTMARKQSRNRMTSENMASMIEMVMAIVIVIVIIIIIMAMAAAIAIVRRLG